MTSPRTLADYLPKQQIHPHAQAITANELLETLTHDLHAAGTISDPHTFTRALHTCLTHGTHGFHGIALLTTRNRTVNTPAAAFARISPDLAWHGADNHQIRDVFLLTAPTNQSTTPAASRHTPPSPATLPTPASAACWPGPVRRRSCMNCSALSGD